MSFPIINFKATQTDLDDAMRTLTEQKLQTLEKFFGDASVLCDVEFEKVAAHQNGDIYRVEVNLQVDGTLFRAEATLDSFEKAIDEVRDELDKELRRARKKHDTLVRRGGRMIKDMLRFGKE